MGFGAEIALLTALAWGSWDFGFPGAGAVAMTRAPPAASLRVNFPENWMWMRYTQPRVMPGSEHLEEMVQSGSFTQRLDHLDPDDNRTWTQGYKWTNATYQVGGPAFFLLAGTSELDYHSDWLRSGQMADLARECSADRFLIPMRFYSEPYATVDASVESLEYLRTEQVLQDIRALLEHLREAGAEAGGGGLLRAGQRVVLFGGGYAGAIATWARQRFPDLVHAAVVSGAVVEPRVQLAAYFPIISHAVNTLHEKDLQCQDNLEKAFLALDALLDTPEGRQTFNDLFDPCTPLVLDKAVPNLDRAQTVGMIASFVADLVQENVDSESGDTLDAPCKMLKFLTTGETVVSALASVITLSEYGRCFEYGFDALVEQASDDAWESPQNKWGIRPWLWQQCTEMGLFATSSRTAFPYSSRITMDFHKALCSRVFGSGYDYSALIENMRSLLEYGGRAPNVSNVVFIKGDLDPWRESSPADSFSSSEHPVFTVRRASHANDMFRRDDYDPPRLKAVRKRVAAILRAWLA